MSQQEINVGTTANDRKGDSLRIAFQKVNANFTELYTALGLDQDDLNLGAFEFNGSTITTTDSSSIVIDQSTTITSDLTVGGDLLPSGNIAADIGSPTNRFRDLYLSSNTIYLGGTTLSVAGGALQIGGTSISDVVKTALTAGGPGTFTDTTTAGNGTVFTGGLFYDTQSAAISTSINPDGDLNSLDAGVNVSGGRVLVSAAQQALAGTTFGSVDVQPGTVIINVNDGDANPEWTFSTDGSITFPDGTIQPTAFLGGSPAQLENGSYTVVLGADGGLTLPTGFIKPSTTDKGLIIEGPLTADMIPADPENPSSFNTVSNGVNIRTYRIGDDLTRDWTYSWDGTLYPPYDANSSQVGAIEWRTPNFYGQLKSNPGYDNEFGSEPAGLKLLTYNGNGAIILQPGNNTAKWIFGTDGSLQIPGDIKSEGNINIDINLSDSTLRRWRFGEDGDLTFPDSTVQNTAYPGIISTHSGQNRIEVGGTPATMDGLSVRLVSSAPGANEVEINYQPAGTEAISVNRYGTNVFSGVEYIANGNTTWFNIDNFDTLGDGTEFTVTDYSGKIYRVNVIMANITATSPSVVTGDAYCVIERLK